MTDVINETEIVDSISKQIKKIFGQDYLIWISGYDIFIFPETTWKWQIALGIAARLAKGNTHEPTLDIFTKDSNFIEKMKNCGIFTKIVLH